MSDTTLKKSIKDINVHFCFDKKEHLTTETLGKLTVLTFQHLLAKHGRIKTKSKAILECENGELVMTQTCGLDDNIYQLFSLRLNKDDKDIPLIKAHWDHFELVGTESYIKFNLGSERCFFELIENLRLLGNVIKNDISLAVLFYSSNRDVINSVCG